jgi:ribonuclease J
MSITITCYGGVAEIGGSKFLLEDGASRLFFDFGIAFGRQGEFFNEYLRPRVARGLLDLLALGLIPPLEGVYRDDLAAPGLWTRFQNHPQYRNLRRDAGKPAIDAVFISHAHLDHNGDLSYLDPAIPVYSSRISAFVARAMQITGQSGFERELTYTSPRTPSQTGELVSDRKRPYQARAWRFLDGALSETAKEFWEKAPVKSKGLAPAPAKAAGDSVAGLPFRWWAVDHSIPGAIGCAVQTSAGWIGYTGDIRVHGKRGDATRRFAQELAALEPVALLCEGTHIQADTTLTEAGIVDNALPLVQAAPGKLAVADFSPRNVERLFSFLDVAERTGRKLLVQPKDVYLLKAIIMADDSAFPAPATRPNLAVYADPKSAPRPWEVALRKEWADRTVTAAEVSADPGAFLLAFSLWDANDLLDMEGIQGGIYLFSNSRAYDEEQAADLDRLRNWVNLMGLTLHGDPDASDGVPLHAAGHAVGPQLVEFVKTVHPKTLIAIHTEQPEWWQEQLKGTDINIHLPQLGRPITIP